MYSFKAFMEDSQEVLRKIMASPNQPKNRDWEKYADTWDVKGNFVEKKIPTEYLLKLIQDRKLRTSASSSEEGIAEKIKSKNLNAVIITKPSGYHAYPLVAVDGNHSLAAAVRSKIPEIDVLISPNAAAYLGI
jgi:hypothetical protein